MNEQNQRDSIMSMARGAFEERVDYEMDKVIQNILDPNTKATAKRKITLTIELTPDDERRTMLTNGCVMKHIADDVDKADEMEIRFYSEASNPATYTPTAKWDATGGKILKDLEAMIRMLTKRGLRASDLVCSPDVADTIINDAAVQKLLDNRRIEIGNAEPELLPDGAAIVARLNVLGRIISVISYDLTYTDDEGNDKLYIPSGKCVLTAPGAGRTAYGAVSQVEQSDGEFHTYAGRRVPKYVSSAEGNSRTLTISSRPLMIPNNKNPFIVADVLTD